MSTRSSLAHADGFHLYHDLAEAGSDVFLCLRGKGVEYSASPGSVTVRIPADVWESIRQCPALTFEYADMGDDEMRAMVESDVDERIAEHAAARTDRSRALTSLAGSACYGLADDPRERQVAAGLKYFSAIRDYQRGVRAKMAAHKVYVK